MSTYNLPPHPGELRQQSSSTSENCPQHGSQTQKNDSGVSGQANLKNGEGAARLGRALKDGELDPSQLERDETRSGTPSGPSDGSDGLM